ncbi:MAG TPA: polysaccharide biosynthesis tyrosine autokinase [Paludibacteraceae bacterium]|nr:polysaccharide biosynthesis tyrosine autokinase [Paludibacteraceae bacterium]
MDEYYYSKQKFNDEEESGFDIKEWIALFLHYWYLFVVFGVLALGLAYLKNRSLIESFQSSGTLIIEETRYSNGSQALMQGFGVQAGYSNVDNQIVMLTSYDLINRVVDSLPQLNIDYISKGRFKTRNLYSNSPIQINSDYVDPNVYGALFKISLKTDGSFIITDEDGTVDKSLKIQGRYGEPLQHNLFFITVFPNNQQYTNQDLYFRFRSKESLVSDFISRLDLKFVLEGSSVLNVSLISETPERDIDFINKLCQTFLAENLERKNDAATKTMRFIDEQLDAVSKSLSVSEGAMTEFRRSNQIVDLPTHSTEVLGKATQYDEKRAELKLRETYLNYLTNYLRTNLASGAVVAPSSLGLNEPMLMALVQQFNELISERNKISERNPLYAKYDREIDNLKLSINEVVKNMRASMNIEEDDLNKKIAGVQKEIDALPNKEMEMISIERKYRVDDNYYTFFLQKRAEAAIQKASNSPDNNILDKARVITQINQDKKSRTTLIYLLIGLLIPAIFVILKELLNNTIRNMKDVEKNGAFTLLGAIRHTHSTDPILAGIRPRSSFTEMFRVIRTRIEFIVQRKSKIAIMATSAESGDGKTYFCTNLASVYALTGLKTLLMDMDIRKPSINNRLGITEKNGVTNYLIGEFELNDLILRKDGIPFDILLAGTVPPNPGELIRSDKLKDMFAQLRTMYDYIIVDSSPIGLVADAYSLAPLMDTNLMVVRSEKTNKGFFKKLNIQLKADNISNMYTVINDVKPDGTSYSKYTSNNSYGYGYGYGYGTKEGKKKGNSYTHYYEDDNDF